MRPVVKFQKLAKDKSSLVRVFSISVLVTQRQRETSGSRIGEVTAGCVAAPVKRFRRKRCGSESGNLDRCVTVL